MARVLLVGAAGFIGRHVAEALDGHEIIALGRTPRADVEQITLDLAITPIEVLVREIARCRVDAIVNCSGAIIGDDRALVAANVSAIASLLEAIARAAPGVRFVQIGSAAEYGSAGSDRAVVETVAPRPVSPYGVTKLAGTQLVLAASMAGRIDGIVIRAFNPVGAGMSEATLPGGAAAKLRAAIASGATSIRLGPLSASRDFVDVRDVAVAIAGAAFADSPRERIFNCSSGRDISSRALVEQLVDVAGFTGSIVEETAGSPRSPSIERQVADVRRIHAWLGWTARRPLRGALEHLWAGSGAP